MEDAWPRPYYPRVDAVIVSALRPAIWLAFAGALVVVLDFTIGGWSSVGFDSVGPEGGLGRPAVTGVQIDLLHDSVGYLLVLLALGHLRRAPGSERSRRLVPAIAVVVLAGVPVSLLDSFVGWRAGVLGLAAGAFDLLAMLAALAFMWTVMEMCSEALERRLARAWRHAIVAAVVFWATPQLFLMAAALALLLGGSSPVRVDVDSVPSLCAVLLVVLLPLVWIGIAFFRTSGWVAPARLTSCHVCGYRVLELPRAQCPECGTEFSTERGSPAPGGQAEVAADGPEEGSA